MEEPVGAQFAIHIALHTLKDRCKQLQERVSYLEEENLSLRVLCSKNDEKSTSLTEIDTLKGQITELSEQKQQLLYKMKMVTKENQELWTKLSRLTHVNESLGSQLNKINDSLSQYTSKNKELHQPLIRSKTFTQDEPHTKVLQRNLEENGKVCSELEEISLKIINSFAQSKNELESLYSDIMNVHSHENVISDSCGFFYDEYDNNALDNFNSIIDDLKATKEVVLNQKLALQLVLTKLKTLEEDKKKSVCDNAISKVEMLDKGTQFENSAESPPKSSFISKALPQVQNLEDADLAMICPVCCKNFSHDTDFGIFHAHVEKHFTLDDAFEVVGYENVFHDH